MKREIKPSSSLVRLDSAIRQEEESDSLLLPHERVGSDFSWLQGPIEDVEHKKEDVEDEESFLYGNEEDNGKQHGVTLPVSQSRPTTQQGYTETPLTGRHYFQNNPPYGNHGATQDLRRPHHQASSNTRPEQRAQPATILDMKECEKIKNMLKNIGLNLRTAEISKMMVKLQEQKKQPFPTIQSPGFQSPALPLGAGPQQEPKLANTPAHGSTPLRLALESLHSIIKGENL